MSAQQRVGQLPVGLFFFHPRGWIGPAHHRKINSVERLSDLIDHFPCGIKRLDVTPAVGNHEFYIRLLSGRHHGIGFFNMIRHGLFHQDMLGGVGGIDGHRGVQMVG